MLLRRASPAGFFWRGIVLAGCLSAVQQAYTQVPISPQPATLSDAQLELSRTNYAAAETLYKRLLGATPNDPAIIDGLALTLYLQGRDSEAISVLTREPHGRLDPKAFALLASSNCRLGNIDRAADALRHLKPWPKDDALLAQIASCVSLVGDPLDGVVVYQQLVDRHVQPEDEFAVGLARAYIQASKSVLSRLKNLPDGEQYIKAIDAAQSSSTTDATSEFGAAQREYPTLSRDMSLASMASLLQEHPDQAAATYGVGVILGERGMATYADVEDRFPDSVPLRLFQAEMLISTDRNIEAVSKYREILQDHPDATGLHFRIGQVYGSDHHWDQALTEYRLQEKITPADERVRQAITNCLISAGRFKESYGYLKPFASKPDVPERTLIDFATSAENTGHVADALKALQRVETLDPSNATIRYRLFQFYKSTHDSAKAAVELAAFTKLRDAQHARPVAK